MQPPTNFRQGELNPSSARGPASEEAHGDGISCRFARLGAGQLVIETTAGSYSS
jgi:hypothetical protein